MLKVVLIIYFVRSGLRSSPMDRALPAFIKVGILSANVIVQNWVLLDGLEGFA